MRIFVLNNKKIAVRKNALRLRLCIRPGSNDEKRRHFISLPNSEIVEATVHALTWESLKGKTFIDLSTSFPISTRKLAEELAQNGAVLLDGSFAYRTG